MPRVSVTTPGDERTRRHLKSWVVSVAVSASSCSSDISWQFSLQYDASVGDMTRYLIWTEGDANGWGCSNCRWRFPIPTLLSTEEAKAAYDRLAEVKFREHKCEAETSVPAAKQRTKLDAGTGFAERARMLIKRGYTPKVAVDLVLHEMEFEHGNNSRMMESARADAEDFLLRIRKGLI
jgi:hypothetical protein